MRTTTSIVWAMALLLASCWCPTPSRAQEGELSLPGAYYTNCYPTGSHSRATAVARPTGVDYSYFGKDVTPRGTLKVLIIFAGFTNDISTQSPNYYDPKWPQEDATHAPGTTFPANPNASFYSSATSFSTTATDHTLSNFYYQMSQHSGNPLKIQAVFFPKRINVTGTDVENASGFPYYNQKVLDAISNDPDTHNFNFSQVDQRGAAPVYQNDNSLSAPNNEVDYTIIIWRNPKRQYLLNTDIYLTGGGFASLNAYATVPSANNQIYIINRGFTSTMEDFVGLDENLFQHEFAHSVYDSPHYFFANSVIGNHFYGTQGPGMMAYFKTHDAANSWERWYLGWIELQTGVTHVNSDIQGAASLTATNGEYTLRDYITTGDVIRILIPGTTQYLWLENHQHKSVFDERNGWPTNSQTPPLPFPGAPTGIMATVEDMSGSRDNVINKYGLDDITGCNGLKVLSAQGSFDYTPSPTSSTYNNYLYNHEIYDFTNPIANPFGGENQLTNRRLDGNGDNEIYNNRTGGNAVGSTHDEHYYSLRLNNAWENGLFGPNAEFNNVGQKLGISYNPAIFEHQRYDQTNAKLLPIHLNGISVELIAKDANTGDITVKVRYDDVAIAQNTRWSGDLQMSDVPGATNGADVSVNAGKTLTINRSGTNNRHTKLAGAFINPTTFVCGGAGVLFLQNGGSTVNVEGANTAFQVKNGGELKLNPYGTTFAVKTGAVLDIQDGGIYTGWYASTTRIEAGGSLVVRRGGKLRGYGGLIQVQAGAYLCLEAGADLSDGGVILDVAPGAIIGANPALGLPALDCRSQLQFCGLLTGNNPDLSTICPTRNEALSFDGNDDVVTMPYDSQAPLSNLGQTFTIEATIRADYTSGGTQTLFTNRYTDANYKVKGALLSLYNGHYLLCQLEGHNYFSLSDPGMSLPASGCHHVAVSHDANNQLHFYIDGVPANYAPTAPYSAATTTGASFGYDPNFPNEGFIGQMGELRVWNTARSSTDINALQAAGLTAPQAGLVGYFGMGGSGQEVYDGSHAGGGNPNPAGYLGSSLAVESNDPTFVMGANLTCNVKGHFRSALMRPTLADTTGQGKQRPLGKRSTEATAPHLSQLTLSPNPASGEAVLHFQLRDAGPVTVSVQDLAGLARATAPMATTIAAGAHDVRLPLHNLRPGVYAVVVVSADGHQVIRLEVR